MNDQLDALVNRYRRSPEFMFADLTHVNARGMSGDTLLHAAVVRGKLEDVNLLIASGADVNAVGDLGNTPLHYAASRELTDIAHKLVSADANLKTVNEFGETPADVAAVMGHSALSAFLKSK